jgi:hypothetical protein
MLTAEKFKSTNTSKPPSVHLTRQASQDYRKNASALYKRYSCFGILVGIVMIIIQSFFLHPGHNSEKKFLGPNLAQLIQFAMVFCLPVLFDTIVENCQSNVPKDEFRPIILFSIIVPSFLISLNAFPIDSLPLVLYMQNALITLIVSYHLCKTSGIGFVSNISVTRQFVACLTNITAAFLYSFAYCDIFPFKNVFKAIFGISIIFYYSYIGSVGYQLIKHSPRFLSVSYVDDMSIDFKVYLILLIFTSLPPLTFLLSYPFNAIFFSHNQRANAAIEIFFALIAVIVMCLKQFLDREQCKRLQVISIIFSILLSH